MRKKGTVLVVIILALVAISAKLSLDALGMPPRIFCGVLIVIVPCAIKLWSLRY